MVKIRLKNESNYNHQRDWYSDFLGDLYVSSPSYLKQTRIAVKLSALRLRIDSVIRLSTALPAFSCMDPSFLKELQIMSTISIDSSLSRIPSQHKSMKSSLPVSLNLRISGSEEIIPFRPPNSVSLASMSPNVLDTDNFPGKIRRGPITFSFLFYNFDISVR